jgi:hypothetical protein
MLQAPVGVLWELSGVLWGLLGTRRYSAGT